MTVIYTPLILFLLIPIFVWLSIQVVKQRRIHRVAIGDNGIDALQRAISVHNNFAQYVPIVLISLLLLELNHAPAWLLIVLGIWFVMARGVHAYGVSQTQENYRFRRFGMFGTISVLAFSNIATVYYALL